MTNADLFVCAIPIFGVNDAQHLDANRALVSFVDVVPFDHVSSADVHLVQQPLIAFGEVSAPSSKRNPAL